MVVHNPAAAANIPDADVDEIVAQSPTANSSGFVSPRISVLVATPAGARQYVMPSFIGRNLSQVSDQLEEAGFKLGEVTDFVVPALPGSGGAAEHSRSASIAAPAIIVKQNPAAGQKVSAGTTVSFEVAR